MSTVKHLVLLLILIYTVQGRSAPKGKTRVVSTQKELKNALSSIKPRTTIEINATSIQLNKQLESYGSNITIKSALVTGTTITCDSNSGGAFAIFGAPVTFSGLRFEGCGPTAVNIAVEDDGPIIFDGVEFIGNLAGRQESGAALSITGCQNSGCRVVDTFPVVVVIRNCRFEGNAAGRGGAIFADNVELSISNSMFADNVAFSQGGAIYVTGVRSTLLVESTGFTANRVNSTGSSLELLIKGGSPLERLRFKTFPFPVATGGAIDLNSISNATIRESAFIENQAPSGGAIATKTLWDAKRGKLKVTFRVYIVGCSFQRNRALNQKVGKSKPRDDTGLLGGAIYTVSTDENLDWTAEACEFEDNIADDGGAIHIVTTRVSTPAITTCRFSRNKANSYGGAIVARNTGLMWITECDIFNNEAQIGGGVAVTNHALLLLNGLASIPPLEPVGRPVQLTHNVADRGGGLACMACNDMVITDTIFSQNVANTEGGGLYVFNTKSDIDINQATFDSNSALVGGGAAFDSAARVKISAIAETLRTIFANNEAVAGAALAFTASNPKETRFLLSHTDFRSNKGNDDNSTSVNGRAVVHLVLDNIPKLSVVDILLTNVSVRYNSGYKGGGMRIDIDGKWNLKQYRRCPETKKSSSNPCRQLRFVGVEIMNNVAKSAPGLFVTDSRQISVSCDAGPNAMAKPLSRLIPKTGKSAASVDGYCTVIDDNFITDINKEVNVKEAKT